MPARERIIDGAKGQVENTDYDQYQEEHNDWKWCHRHMNDRARQGVVQLWHGIIVKEAEGNIRTCGRT